MNPILQMRRLKDLIELTEGQITNRQGGLESGSKELKTYAARTSQIMAQASPTTVSSTIDTFKFGFTCYRQQYS